MYSLMLYLITVPPFHTIWELLLLGARSHPPFIMKQSSGWHHLQILTDFDKIIDFRCFMKVKASLFISGKNIWISFLPAVVVQHRLAAVDLNFDLTHFASLPPFCKQTRRLLRLPEFSVISSFLVQISLTPVGMVDIGQLGRSWHSLTTSSSKTCS